MENEKNNVFFSTIIRNKRRYTNNYKDILNIVPAKPIPFESTGFKTCDYQPKYDKYYIPRKKTGFKVKTVRDIRITFEKDSYGDLIGDLEKQENYLLRKIKLGYTNNVKFKETAKKMLKRDSPLSKSLWQMLVNINIEDNAFPTQFVLWNGKPIRVNGSRGGNKKFISKYDIGRNTRQCKNVTTFQNRNKKLLQNSLHINFKPGPLSQKKHLDISYQKQYVGNTEIVSLPKTGLELQLAYGKPVTPDISAFLFDSFAEDSNKTIPENWANFAVSVLGSNVKGTPVQLKQNNNVTFDLKYKSFQNRLLMRHDNEYVMRGKQLFNSSIKPYSEPQEDYLINLQVKDIINNMLGAVEISLNQDTMYSDYDEVREIQANSVVNVQTKDKGKRKYCELERLDVTVIRLNEKTIEKSKECLMSYCKLGCICDSLSYKYKIRAHCGRIECMFKCSCDFPSFNLSDLEQDDTESLPEIITNKRNICSKLSKEEQKFHQTVIVTDKKRIVLKSCKRNSKTSKKYVEFFRHNHTKTNATSKGELSVVVTKLDCRNIEPWCLVHGLYRCFCKGKFTHMASVPVDAIKTLENVDVLSLKVAPKDDLSAYSQECDNQDSNIRKTRMKSQIINQKTSLDNNLINKRNEPSTENRSQTKMLSLSRKAQKLDLRQETKVTSITESKNTQQGCLLHKSLSINNEDHKSSSTESDIESTAARVQAYAGRLYSENFYLKTHSKIREIESNDKRLQQKLNNLVNKTDCNMISDSENTDTSLSELLSSVVECSAHVSKIVIDKPINSKENKRLPNTSKLVSWLEISYKQYKARIEKGIKKMYLGPPQAGKLALYPWDFILSRFQEHKNYFLVSNKKPCRLFIAVTEKHLSFHSCININNIQASEIDEYPQTVKNLLSNAIDLKDNFCILNGLSYCWELIGSVSKVNDKGTSTSDVQTFDMETNSSVDNWDIEGMSRDKKSSDYSLITANSITNEEYERQHTPDSVEHICDTSKWFIMMVENDFREIQFYKKGFFVKYDSIIKAINVARITGKTVRLSSQKSNKKQKDPQFGIYAIPNKDELCVFIGPYYNEENLGIEIINTVPEGADKRTRGIWITSKKIDNYKVIDNPLSFIPLNANYDQIISSNRHLICDNILEDKINSQIIKPTKILNKAPIVKTIKPIRIRKTNGFYQLASNGLFKHVSPTSPETPLLKNVDAKFPLKRIMTPTTVSNSTSSGILANVISSAKNTCNDANKNVNCNKPVAEIAPQIKSLSDYIPKKKKMEGGMFVLKPEEINKKSQEGLLYTKVLNKSEGKHLNEIQCMDIDDFLATNDIKAAPTTDIYIISDEDDSDSQNQAYSQWTNEYIICKNIENLGWIQGRRDSNKRLSFQFPGFKESDFYTEKKAYEKINQVFSRKVYIPKDITLQWRTSDDPTEIITKPKLNLQNLGADYVMTEKGLQHKYKLLSSSVIKDESSQTLDVVASTSDENRRNKRNNIFSSLIETIDLSDQEDVSSEENFELSFDESTGASFVETSDVKNAAISDVVLVKDEEI